MKEQQPRPNPYNRVYEGLFTFNSKSTIIRGASRTTHPVPSSCHLEVFTNNGLDAVVIATEIAGNGGMSITNAAGLLAEQVAKRFELLPERTSFIEHYTEESYKDRKGQETWDQVHLTWKGTAVLKTNWQRISKAEVDAMLDGHEQK